MTACPPIVGTKQLGMSTGFRLMYVQQCSSVTKKRAHAFRHSASDALCTASRGAECGLAEILLLTWPGSSLD